MNILTWNIQAGKGCDGNVDTARIIEHIKTFKNVDVICLQEVARNIIDLNTDDQTLLISDEFSDYIPVWAPGFSVPVGPAGLSAQYAEFGNLTLVRQPLYKNSRIHSLPSPWVAELQIPRTMAEVTLVTNTSELSLFNAHLAFHSAVERIEQIQALTRLREQIMSKLSVKNKPLARGVFALSEASEGVILCGDLNVDSDSQEFKTYISDEHWFDCWQAQHNLTDHEVLERQPTCGCFDITQWPQGPHIRDYFLATKNIQEKTISVAVDVDTDASDHQPVLLEIAL